MPTLLPVPLLRLYSCLKGEIRASGCGGLRSSSTRSSLRLGGMARGQRQCACPQWLSPISAGTRALLGKESSRLGQLDGRVVSKMPRASRGPSREHRLADAAKAKRSHHGQLRTGRLHMSTPSRSKDARGRDMSARRGKGRRGCGRHQRVVAKIKLPRWKHGLGMPASARDAVHPLHASIAGAVRPSSRLGSDATKALPARSLAVAHNTTAGTRPCGSARGLPSAPADPRLGCPAGPT